MSMKSYDTGPVLDDGVAEEHVLDRLKLWLPSMLDEQCAARGLTVMDPHPHPERGYSISSFEERHAEQPPPMVLVHSPGTLNEPDVAARGAGNVSQWQRVNVLISAGGRSEPGTRGKAHRLIAAARRVLLQQVPGDGPVQQVRYLGARYDLPLRAGSNSRQRLVCGLSAAALVPDVVSTRGPFPETPEDVGYPVPDGYSIAVTREVTKLP